MAYSIIEWHEKRFNLLNNKYKTYPGPNEYRIKETWLFRGMQNSNWALETTFERLMKYHQVTSNDEKNAAEQKMLNNFKRYAYAVFKRVPNENELEEWLTLMQHYEVSTRLLDWTYSFYVALFFATEHLEFNPDPQHTDHTKTCSVWAIKSDVVVEKSFDNLKKFSTKSEAVLAKYLARGLKKIGGRFNPVFEFANQFEINGIFHMSPLYQNERLRNQQGTFLVPLNLHNTFEDTLNKLKIDQNKNIKKFNITLNKEQQQKILKILHSMNINHSTIYPDIKGYGQHINTTTMLEHPFTPIS